MRDFSQIIICEPHGDHDGMSITTSSVKDDAGVRARSGSPRTPGPESCAPADPPDATRFGSTLVLWMILTACLHGAFWLSGWRSLALAEAVEQGAALAESRTFGEVHDDTIRRSIRTQRDTLPFWTAMTVIGDFVLDPMTLVLRALAVTTAFCAVAALSGRPVQFGATCSAVSSAQGIWVLGLVVQLAAMVVLRIPEADTSLTLALPSGTYKAPVWVALHQLDAFALVGWLTLAWGGWRRGQANLVAAFLICGLLWATEATTRIGWTLTIESGMRLLLIPEWMLK